MGSIELSTGIQISGHFSDMIQKNNELVYFNTVGETAISINGIELIGHGKDSHPNGFGSPIGKLDGINMSIEDMSPKDLEVYGIIEGKMTMLKFESGVIVKGKIITGKRDLQGKIILISFEVPSDTLHTAKSPSKVYTSLPPPIATSRDPKENPVSIYKSSVSVK